VFRYIRGMRDHLRIIAISSIRVYTGTTRAACSCSRCSYVSSFLSAIHSQTAIPQEKPVKHYALASVPHAC